LQLTELPFAIRSPTAASEELQNHGLVAAKIGQAIGLARRVPKLEVRRGIAYIDNGLGGVERKSGDGGQQENEYRE
jgi:hypothetical protein